jgi:hypothetical protein
MIQFSQDAVFVQAFSVNLVQSHTRVIASQVKIIFSERRAYKSDFGYI